MPEYPRIMIFIDGSNLFRSQNAYARGYRLDYVRLIELLSQGGKLVESHYYGSQRERSPEQQTRFHHLLQGHGLKLHIFQLVARGGSLIEKRVDVALAVDMLAYAYEDHYDLGVLVSGDGDFLPLVERVQSLKKLVRVASFSGGLSRSLVDGCPDVVILDVFAEHVRLYQ